MLEQKTKDTTSYTSFNELLDNDFRDSDKEIIGFIDYLSNYYTKIKDNRLKLEACFISMAFNTTSEHELHEYFRLLKEDFFSSNIFRFMFSCLKKMYSSNLPIDIVTFYNYISNNEVENNKTLVDALTLNELINIKNMHVDLNLSFHFNQYVLLMREFYLKDRVLKLSRDVILDISQKGKDIFSVIDYMRDFIDGLESDVAIESDNTSIKDISDSFLENITNKEDAGDRIMTNLHSLDYITGGFKKGELIVVAGRPGMGKSAIVNRFFYYPAICNNIPTLLITLEMTKTEAISRIIANICGVNISNIITKKLSEEEIKKIKEGIEFIKDKPMYIEDNFSLGLSEIKVKIREYVQKKKVKLVVIDHIGLMDVDTVPKKRMDNRVLEIGEITRTLKKMAKELSIPIVAVSQLNREVEKRMDKKPVLSDLRDSGNIEQDANIVLFCYRPEYYLDANIKLRQNSSRGDISEDFIYYIGEYGFNVEGLFVMNVAKNRHGRTGDIALFYEKEYTRVINHPGICIKKGENVYPIYEEYMLDDKWKTFMPSFYMDNDYSKYNIIDSKQTTGNSSSVSSISSYNMNSNYTYDMIREDEEDSEDKDIKIEKQNIGF